MVQFLTSNLLPARFNALSFKDYFEDALSDSNSITIASGFISTEALLELAKIAEENRRPNITLLIGMHFFSGFTRTQYEAALSLASVLKAYNLGSVRVSTTVKFHGKVYCFKSDKFTSVVVGSSNISSIFSSSEQLYETDILITETDLSEEVSNKMDSLIERVSRDIADVEIKTFRQYSILLEGQEKVGRVSQEEFLLLEQGIEDELRIPINAEALKSNLNAYFGKGRQNQRGFIKPRPWYEVELIIPKKFTDLKSFPYMRTFWVYTDDRWKFQCKTQGDFSKNFRSVDDLQILGKWIKGRLEQSGALKVGHPVNQSVLNKYGRDYITLKKTSDPDIWILDFSV